MECLPTDLYLSSDPLLMIPTSDYTYAESPAVHYINGFQGCISISPHGSSVRSVIRSLNVLLLTV
jgi:hypothetical protein